MASFEQAAARRAAFIESSGYERERRLEGTTEELVSIPILAALSRAGFLPTGSQTGVPMGAMASSEMQRARIDGFLPSWRVPEFFRALKDHDVIGWKVIPSPVEDSRAMFNASIPVQKTRKPDGSFKSVTFMRTNLTKAELEHIQTAEAKIGRGEDVSFVIVFDATWGRHAHDVLYPAIAHAMEKSALK